MSKHSFSSADTVLPAVSFVMPVLNEESYLKAAVEAIFAQRYPADFEIVLALGPSTDATAQIATHLGNQHPEIRIVHNPERDIPIALNLAIEAARYSIIVRVDAHSELSPGYVETAVRFLQQTGAANVGGIMRAAGTTPVQQAIAGGYNSPLGLGGGTYHFSTQPHTAESAYLGVFPRSTFDLVGGFDPTIRRGEDWEFNLRVRRSGGVVWFDPSLAVTYWPRSSWRALSKQFFSTGSWRATLVKKYPSETPWRFFIPGAYVCSLTVSLAVLIAHVSGFITPTSWWPYIFYSAPVLHGLVTLLAGVKMPETKGVSGALRGALAVAVMHIAWGTGFVQGLVFGSGKIVDRSRATRR